MQARYAIWHTVKALDQQYMEAQLARAGTPSPRVIRKGHTYRIVVSDLLHGRPDRSEASLSEFYAWLGEKKEHAHSPCGDDLHDKASSELAGLKNKGAEMQFVGIDTRTLKGRKGITRAEFASAVEQIVATVVDEHGLTEATDVVTLGSKLQDDLGMDEVDQMEVLFRAEERFSIVLPDNDIGPSSTMGDIVARIAERLGENEGRSSRVEAIQAA